MSEVRGARIGDVNDKLEEPTCWVVIAPDCPTQRDELAAIVERSNPELALEITGGLHVTVSKFVASGTVAVRDLGELRRQQAAMLADPEIAKMLDVWKLSP
jgi:hypothetical protein